MAIRVYQIAKEYGRTPEEVLSLLKQEGISLPSQTAKLDEHALHTVTAKLGKFKLTVVDGDIESKVAEPVVEPVEEPAAKPVKRKAKAAPSRAKKAKKKEPPPPPPPRLGVRII